MDKTTPFFSIWHKPRETIAALNQRPSSPFEHLRLVLLLASIAFIELVLFVLTIETFPKSDFLSMKGLKAALSVFLLIVVSTYALANLSTLVYWLIAKKLKGLGSLHQTRTAFMWSLVTLIPLGVFCLLIQFTLKQSGFMPIWLAVRIISYFGVLASLIYGCLTLLKTFAETHRFTLWRAFSALTFGNLSLFIILYYLVKRVF